MPIEFDDSLKTGVEVIDEQHQQLIEIHNKLEQLLKQGKAHRHMDETLAQLYNYAKFHFESEEQLLADAAYDGLEDQKIEHRQLLKRLKEFITRFCGKQERISGEVTKFVAGWITNHIRERDMQYVPIVKASLGEADAPAESPEEPVATN